LDLAKALSPTSTGQQKGITMLTLATLRTQLLGTRILIIVAALAGFFALGTLAMRTWLAAHDAAIHLSATLKAQEEVLAQANERQRQRDASLTAALAQINAAKRRVTTPAQVVAELPQALPPLPKPIELQLPPSTPELLAPPAVATVPQADLKPLYDYLQDCRACQASLTAASDNLTDERAKLAALTAERDAAIRATRGGGFWSRLGHNTKWFAIGAALGVIATTASR
jgi:hypothetical protein